MKKVFLLAAAALLCFACEKENMSDNPAADSGTSKKAYMAINLLGNTPATKAAADPTPGSGQDAVNDVHFFYFDQNNIFLGASEKFTSTDFTKNDASYQTKTPVEVPAETKKIFVIVNNSKSNGNPRFRLPGQSDIGRPWSVLNQTLSFRNTEAGVNDFIKDYTGTQDGKDNYVMANSGVQSADDNGLVTVTTAIKKEDAPSNDIFIDRLASKVEFKIIKIGTPADNEILATPNGAKFFFQGWEMNATNRFMRLYAEHDPNYTQPAINGILTTYRKDANYTLTSYGTVTDWTEYKNQFVYLHNATRNVVGSTTSPITNAAGDIVYCPENTMEATAQVVGATTKVVVKGNYVPNIFNAGESYFTYDGLYYSLTTIKQLYADAVAAAQSGGIVDDMKAFLIDAKLAVDGDDIAAKVAALTADMFDANTGIIARTSNAVRYFHQGVSYYEVLIRHDTRITGTMAFAKYGTVRNNWYTLTLNSISRPGTPWIPGGPDDQPTDPSTPDDNVAQLDVTIKINPWVQWSQLIDL